MIALLIVAGLIFFASRLGESSTKDSADAMGAAVLTLVGALFAGLVAVAAGLVIGWCFGRSRRANEAKPGLWLAGAGAGMLVLFAPLLIALASAAGA